MSSSITLSEIKPTVSVAFPMAEDKVEHKASKLIVKAREAKTLARGTKEVAKYIRRGRKGICIIAADTHPIYVFAHLPVLCEQNNIPYFFVKSKKALAEAAGTTGAASVVLLQEPSKDASDGEDRKTYKKICQKAEDALKALKKHVEIH